MEHFKRILNVLKEKYMYILIILLATILIFVPYISKNFILGDDYICHVANIFAINENMSLKDLSISKIRSSIANNLGYGNGIFYPQLVYHIIGYIYFIMKKIGFSMISAIKVFEFLLVFLSGITMYQFMQKTFENKRASLVASITYISAPYFISDIFRRMALPEAGIFLFMPIVMLSLTELLKDNHKKFAIYFIIGYVGMILSHLVLTVYFTLLFAILLLINIKKLFNKKTIIYFAVSTLIVLAIVSPFLGPMLEHKINENYIVFADNTMTNIDKLRLHQLSIIDLVKAGSEVMTTHISPVTLVLVLICIIGSFNLLKNFDNVQKNIFIGIAIFSVLASILTLKFINWEYIPKIFWLIQFPWRMCAFIVFGTAVFTGLATSLIKNDNMIINILIILIISTLNLISANKIINQNELKDIPDVTYEEVSNLFDRGLGDYEYLPQKAFFNLFYLKEKGQNIYFSAGAENIRDFAIIENKTPYLQFALKLEENTSVTVEIPRLFYFGYSIKFEDENGKKEKLDYYNNIYGLIEFKIPASGTITINYTGTITNKVCNIISFFTIIGLIVGIVLDTKLSKPIAPDKKLLEPIASKNAKETANNHN